jgi:hypothetical protein
MVAVTPIKQPWKRVAVGEVFEMAPNYAKILVRLGRVAYVEEKPKPKRTYKRRDMQAEE